MKIKLDDIGIIPTRAHKTDSGIDIYSPKVITINANDSSIINTGLHVQIPENCTGLILPKSGLLVNFGILCFGVIDEGYTGEIILRVFNLGKTHYTFLQGEKITQLVIVPCNYEEIEITDKILSGDRGNNGFGSTGRF